MLKSTSVRRRRGFVVVIAVVVVVVAVVAVVDVLHPRRRPRYGRVRMIANHANGGVVCVLGGRGVLEQLITNCEK